MDNTELSFIDFNYTLFFLTIQSAIFDGLTKNKP